MYMYLTSDTNSMNERLHMFYQHNCPIKRCTMIGFKLCVNCLLLFLFKACIQRSRKFDRDLISS